MTKVIDATEYMKSKNSENNFSTWFEKAFGVISHKYMDVFRSVVERFCKESWNKCDAVWRGRYTQTKNNIGDAIELCSCEDSTCDSCIILKAILMKNYN